MEITTEIAKMILKPLRESGIPPKFGLEFFSSGFEVVLSSLEESYLDDIIMKKGSSFKFISASFGGGKTHFTYQFREKAWEKNYATCHVPLDYQNTQFHKLLSVFQAIIKNVQSPLTDEEKILIYGETKKPEELGLPNLIKKWFHLKQQEFKNIHGENWEQNLKQYSREIGRDFENIHFGRVVRNMFECLFNDDLDSFEDLSLWFDGEISGGVDKKFGIKKPVESETFRMIKSLSKLLTDLMGYSGLIIFFDEGERQALRSKDKDIQVANLRQVIDQCGDQSMPSILFMYTVPDENEFLQSKGHAYDAIKQRLQKHFSQEHPLFPNISLERLLSDDDDEVIDNLLDIGKKLSKLYEIGYNAKFPGSLDSSIRNIASSARKQRYGEVSFRRLFIQSVCEGLDLLSNGTENEISSTVADSLVRNEGKQISESEEI